MQKRHIRRLVDLDRQTEIMRVSCRNGRKQSRTDTTYLFSVCDHRFEVYWYFLRRRHAESFRAVFLQNNKARFLHKGGSTAVPVSCSDPTACGCSKFPRLPLATANPVARVSRVFLFRQTTFENVIQHLKNRLTFITRPVDLDMSVLCVFPSG